MIFFQTPKFWYKKPSILQKIFLKPIAAVYSYVSARNYWKGYRHISPKTKVVAVGGITIGGSGKTMVVQSICDILKFKNKKVAVLSRGFGRLSNETLRVDNQIHSYEDVGDEPLLLSYSVPVYVGKDRSQSAKLAERENYDFFILDDGITQKYLKPDLKLVVIDGEQGLGNGEMFPLGPNRLNFEKIKSDVDGIIVLGQNSDFNKFWDGPAFFGEIQQDFSSIKGKILVFCGLGYPDKFFNSLKNFEVVKKVVFPDHYPFPETVLQKLIREAEILGAQLVTTQKDLMRIPSRQSQAIVAVSAKIVWKNPIDALIDI
ncbi:MAG: tetraacyldisaccharide 4'-kinase [Holosporaceae bacterium]|jgi:tetraacyldisaccharide 4'-kinase|nr:tetraacyldisaccharide 4'-kinase [Holosporaceae bacterium]